MPNDRTEDQTNSQAAVFELLAAQLSDYIKVEPAVSAEQVKEIVDERIAEFRVPRPIEIHGSDGEVKVVDGAHAQFAQLVGLIAEGHRNLLMVGPAGSGKTTLASNLAKALGLEFGFISMSAGVTETHLLGRILPQADGSWQYQPSRFVQIYEGGGVFLLDEFDAADANVLVAVNAALANGILCNPVNGQVYKRHADTYIVCAANTWGRGGNTQYVGRNQLDTSTLDRFVLSTVIVDYDKDLEWSIASQCDQNSAKELLDWVYALRARIAECNLRRIASTRLVVNGSRAMRAGCNLTEVKNRYYQDWSVDERAKVGNL